MASPRGVETVLLATDGTASRAIYHALADGGIATHVILEAPQGRWALLWGRARRYGALTAAGQALFQLLVVPWLRARGRTRVAAVGRAEGWNLGPIPAGVTTRVASVNDTETLERIAGLHPRVVVLSGTRILSTAALHGIGVPVVNMHAGITPFCRGVHGAYWALADGRPDLVGTTIHYVDPGIDTGGVILQRTFAPTEQDDFGTYPALHLAAGLPALLETVRRIVRGETPSTVPPPPVPTRLRTHPTLWGYLWRRSRAGTR